LDGRLIQARQDFLSGLFLFSLGEMGKGTAVCSLHITTDEKGGTLRTPVTAQPENLVRGRGIK
jgi:hypothetical protein